MQTIKAGVHYQSFCDHSIGILHGQILRFEGFVRNVWANWLSVQTESVPSNFSYKSFETLDFTNTKFLLWSQKLW
jgi:hypothetical protein